MTKYLKFKKYYTLIQANQIIIIKNIILVDAGTLDKLLPIDFNLKSFFKKKVIIKQ